MFEDIDFKELKERKLISSLRNKNIEKLFKVVENYAKSNYLCERNEDEFYIEAQGSVYRIVHYTYEDDFYFIEKAENIEGKQIFKLEDVLANRISEKQKLIKEKLDIINSNILSLKEEGVPYELVKSSIKMNRWWM